MRRGTTACLVAVVLLAVIGAGCSGRGGSTSSQSATIGADSPGALVERMLTAVRDGDKTALHACFMPGMPSTAWAHLESLLVQKSLTGVKWRVSLERDAGAGAKDEVVEFSPPVAGEGEPYRNLRVMAVRDTADQRQVMLGSAASAVRPAPTGRWVAAVVALVHRYNPG